MKWLRHFPTLSSPVKILVADDNADARSALVQSFANASDRQFEIVANGAEAWWHLSDPADHFDLAILDLEMPPVDGLEVLARIRGDERLRELPVIILSGACDRAAVLRAVELGIVSCFAKPLAVKTLHAKVMELEARLLELGRPT
jgi:CheY-like chemotaxis protein